MSCLGSDRGAPVYSTTNAYPLREPRVTKDPESRPTTLPRVQVAAQTVERSDGIIQMLYNIDDHDRVVALANERGLLERHFSYRKIEIVARESSGLS